MGGSSYCFSYKRYFLILEEVIAENNLAQMPFNTIQKLESASWCSKAKKMERVTVVNNLTKYVELSFGLLFSGCAKVITTMKKAIYP